MIYKKLFKIKKIIIIRIINKKNYLEIYIKIIIYKKNNYECIKYRNKK